MGFFCLFWVLFLQIIPWVHVLKWGLGARFYRKCTSKIATISSTGMYSDNQMKASNNAVWTLWNTAIQGVCFL